MAGKGVAVDSATQTSDYGSDDDGSYTVHEMTGNSSPRVMVDTSPPFGSVEEAVIRFGGRGFWIPQHILAVDAATATDHPPHNLEDSDVHKLDDRAAAMLKDLQRKEQETHEILKELEFTKRLVEELKLKVPKETPDHHTSIPTLTSDRKMQTPNKDYVNKYPIDSTNKSHEEHPPLSGNEPSLPSSAAGLIMTELKQAKHNLFQNTNDLAELRASVEALSKKLETEKASVEKAQEMKTEHTVSMGGATVVNPLAISRELHQLNYEADQFMKTAEAARSEVLKAMSDVEQTKSGLKVIEMRWVVAKKLEDAAKATESLALAEIRALSSNEFTQEKPGRISLSVEEYSALTDKAKKAENMFKRKELDGFRNSFPTNPRRDSRLLDSNEFEFTRNECNKPVARQTATSIGDILSRKLVLRDDLEVGTGRHGHEERGGHGDGGGRGRQRVSLNQMLRRHRGEVSPLKRREKEGSEGKSNFFSKRKALGFVHISLPLSKQSKNKIQALNFWRGEDE